MYRYNKKLNKKNLTILVLSTLVLVLSIISIWTVEDKSKMQSEYEYELNTLNKENIRLENKLEIAVDEYNYLLEKNK